MKHEEQVIWMWWKLKINQFKCDENGKDNNENVMKAEKKVMQILRKEEIE